jgi:hypothetical protein
MLQEKTGKNDHVHNHLATKTSVVCGIKAGHIFNLGIELMEWGLFAPHSTYLHCQKSHP